MIEQTQMTIDGTSQDRQGILKWDRQGIALLVGHPLQDMCPYESRGRLVKPSETCETTGLAAQA